MTVLTHESLLDWLRSWDEMLKKPNDLLFAPSLPNLFDLIVPQLTGKTKLKDWETKLLDLLRSAFQAQSTVVSLLKREHPMEITQLQSLLSQTSYNVPSILAALAPLQNAPSTHLLQRQLKQTLLRPSRSSYVKLSTIAYLLQRKVIDKYDVGELKAIPKRQLIRTGTTILLSKHASALADNPTLTAALQRVWSYTFAKELKSSNITMPVKPIATSVLNIVDSVVWANRTRQLLDQV